MVLCRDCVATVPFSAEHETQSSTGGVLFAQLSLSGHFPGGIWVKWYRGEKRPGHNIASALWCLRERIRKQVFSKLMLISVPLWQWCPPLLGSLFSDTPRCNGFIWLTLQGSLHNTNYQTLKMAQLRKWLHHQWTQWTTAYLQKRVDCSYLLKTITYFLFYFAEHTLKTIKSPFSSWCVAPM